VLNRLFPRALTNAYQGSWLAVWVFTPVLIIKTLMGFNFSGFNPFIDVREILENVDGVLLSTYSAGAVAAIVDSAGSWGVALFTLCLFAWLVLVRYRAGLPFAVLLLLVEQVARTGGDMARVISEMITASATPTAGAVINLSMTALLVVALVLSLLRVRGREA
jgi:hypothetical protein